MSGAIPLLLAIFLAFSFSASAQEVAYAYGESGGQPLESGNVTQYNSSDIVNFTVSASTPGEISYISNRSLESIKEEISRKINRGNELVRDQGLDLIGPISGPRQIDQICAIYDYLVDKQNWSYVSDWTGLETFQYSNYTLKKGQEVGHLGIGDCDDFAILLGAFIESVGASPRIVIAYGPNGGHAYAQVYLGKAEDSGDRVNRTMRWLRNKYHVEDVICHRDLSNGDVWLNLDWWKEPGGANHPGGPFFMAVNHIPVYEGKPLNPVNPINEAPVADFSISPEFPNAGEITTLNASMSRDIGGRIVSYEWDFGDGNGTSKTNDLLADHIYQKGGLYTVILSIEDDEEAENISSKEIIINNPPQVYFTITPDYPIVGDQVKFDASESYDAEDSSRLVYHWDINNNSATLSTAIPQKQTYDEPGMYWINLTVTDKNGAEGHKNRLLKINRLPIPRIEFDSTDLTLGKFINFSAAASEDLDGEIISYAWNFGDNSEVDRNKTALHAYDEGGEKTVKLSVEDNDGAISNISQPIFINRPPIASFSIDPEQPKKGETISFNASASYDPDPDGKIKRYLWDFGIGKAEPDVYNKEFVEHAYSRVQSYNVTLTVEDDKGATGSFSQLVEVRETNSKPILTSLHPDIESFQEMGTAVTWEAAATDAESDPLEFQFLLNGTVVQDWSSSPAWSWNADQVGLHVIEAKVRDGQHDSNGDSSNSATFKIVPPLTDAPVMIALLPNKESPQVTGTAIVWTAEAFDSDNDPLEFQFLLNGAVVQDWTSSPAWNWNADQAGAHWIMVQVRDGDHDLNGDSSKSSSFEIVTPPNDTPVMSELSSNKESPQVKGTAIAWTASASDSEYDPLEFQFLLDGAVVQDWSSSPVWIWNADQAGRHTIEVKARDADHPEGTEPKSAGFEIVLPPNQAPALSSLQPDKESPQQTGSTVAWTASADDAESDSLEFQFLLDGAIIQDWSSRPAWSWNGDQVGSHVIEAKVRDGLHDPNGDSFQIAVFEIAKETHRNFENRITNVRFAPVSPAYLAFEEPVRVSFDYETDQSEYVLIYADFMIGGRIVGPPFDYFTDGSPFYSEDIGSGNFNLSIDSNKIVTVDGVRVHMVDKDGKDLCEITTPAQFHYGPKNISSELQSRYALGNKYFIQNNYSESVKYFDQAIEMAPKLKYAWKDRGDAFSALGEYENAIESYDEALRIEPRFAEAWKEKGQTLFMAGLYEEAVNCFDEAIKCYYDNSLYNDGDLDSARDGKAKALNAMGRNFISEDLDVIDIGLVTLTYSEEILPAGNMTIDDDCSYNFFSIPGKPAKTYGSVDYGDFYFGDNKFFANNAGMQGLVDLGPVEFDIDAIKIPIEGFYNYGLDAIIDHVYVSPARWCAYWEEGKYNISDCGQDDKYIIFRVKNVSIESNIESAEIEYMLVNVMDK